MFVKSVVSCLASVTVCFTLAHADSKTHNAVTKDHTIVDFNNVISDIWMKRDSMVHDAQSAGLFNAHGAHHHEHDHHHDHGIGGAADVQSIDVLGSEDLLTDKIDELNKKDHDDVDILLQTTDINDVFDLSKSLSSHSDDSHAHDDKAAHDDLASLESLLLEKESSASFSNQDTIIFGKQSIAMKPVDNAKITSKYGYRRIFGRSQFHKGIDMAARYGSPIYATGKGVVVYAGWMRGYGRFIEIDHENGYKTRYAHSSRLRVKVGDRVSQRQRIADLGCSGRCTGPHLHYEVKKNGKHVNPNIYLSLARM